MKRKLLFVVALAASALGFNAYAQTDVTGKYIKNAKLTEGTAISVGVCTYEKDKGDNATEFAQLVAVQDWDAVDNKDGKAGGIFSLTNPAFLGGKDYKSPASDADGNKEGNILGLVTCWKASAQYTQNVTLPAGTYTLVLSVYNSAGANAATKNLIGFIANDNTEYLAKTTQYTIGKWIYEFINITLPEKTVGKWSLGYTSPDAGSGNCPHLFFSPLTLFEGTIDEDAYTDRKEWERTINLAEAIELSDYENVVGKEKKDFTSALDAAKSATNENYAEATKVLENAMNAFIAAKANYDLLAKEIAKAKVLGLTETSKYEATEASTAEIVVKNVQDLKVAEYLYVTDTYKYGVALGEWGGSGTNTKPAIFSNEHWSGEIVEYMNQYDAKNPNQGWEASSWKLTAFNNVVIPAGEYVFKVAARQASDAEHMKTSLIVKKGDETLGTVDDFPTYGNTGRGINVEGKTSYDEEDAKYANKGLGFGWEWRYVKFSLDEEAEVELIVEAEATTNKMWVSFGNYTLQATNEATAALIEYNKALKEAKSTIVDTAYEELEGDDKQNLQNAIDAEKELDKTSKDAVEKATEELKELTAALKAAPAQFEAYNTTVGAIDLAEKLPYASEEKYEVAKTAKEVAPSTGKGAAEKTAAIREYVESNALAEGVEGVTVIPITDANMETDYNGTNKTFGAWQVFAQTDGTIQRLQGESFTDSEGKNDYYYADIWKQDNNGGIRQTVTLNQGKYMLTVTARADNAPKTDGAIFRVFAGSDEFKMDRIGNTGGVFGRGWNDVYVEFEVTANNQNVEIGVQSGNGKELWWSATRFRLVRLGDAETLTAEVSEAGYATYVTPTAIDFDGDGIAFVVSNTTDSGTAHLESVRTAPANTPVILQGNGKLTFKSVETADEVDNNLLKVAEEEIPAQKGIYVLAKPEGQEVGFYALGVNLPAGRVYLDANGADVKFIGFNFGDDATAIKGVETTTEAENAVIYNLAGQRVANPTKAGIYIVNGKKVLVK